MKNVFWSLSNAFILLKNNLHSLAVWLDKYYCTVPGSWDRKQQEEEKEEEGEKESSRARLCRPASSRPLPSCSHGLHRSTPIHPLTPGPNLLDS